MYWHKTWRYNPESRAWMVLWNHQWVSLRQCQHSHKVKGRQHLKPDICYTTILPIGLYHVKETKKIINDWKRNQKKIKNEFTDGHTCFPSSKFFHLNSISPSRPYSITYENHNPFEKWRQNKEKGGCYVMCN